MIFKMIRSKNWRPVIRELEIIANSYHSFIKDFLAHRMSVQMAATYKVLDKDSKIGSYAALDGLDLSMLSKCLEVGDLNEPDEEWNWDTLFAQITSEITVRTGAVSPGDAAGNSTAVGSYIH